MKKILIDKINSLPPLPQSVVELERFRSLNNYDIETLIEIIEKDPLMITTILRVSNSSIFGFRGEVESLSRAINLLGVNFTISIAIGTAIQNSISGNLNAYNTNNEKFLYISSLASNIVNTWMSSVDFDLKNELLLPSFLQEIGKFIISDLIESNGDTKQFQKELLLNQDISICEEKFSGYSCSRVTANIFKHWGLSHRLIFPIAFVDAIETCPKDFKKHSQILKVVKILADIRNPLGEEQIDLAINQASTYGLNVEQLVSTIDFLKDNKSNAI